MAKNHKLNERLLMEYVNSGEWSINDNGEILCDKKRAGKKEGGVRLYDVKPYRIERKRWKIEGAIVGK